jgi:superfamily I DNA and/or RNA helicase
MRFDAVALDEATQSVDPVSLVALLRAPRAVLAGDPRQLPPTVLSSPGGRGPLCETLFEREARAHPAAVALLTEQYRMSELLMHFPSAQSYEGRLVCSPEVANRTLESLGLPADPLRAGGLIFIDTAGTGWQEERQDDDPSTSNPGHAQRVAAEVRRLLGRGLAAADVAVIAPYHAQVLLLREYLAEACVQGLEVGSVDGFQGREKEAIVLDLVRSNDSGDIGFLRDVRRMNVAITRARSLLLVVGDSATVGEHNYYAEFLREVEQRGTYLSAWSDEAPAW